ncbi:hypothetical protein GCM10027051_13700 [Niabella terrae]
MVSCYSSGLSNRQVPVSGTYDFEGSRVDGRSLIRRDSQWGYLSRTGKELWLPLSVSWADDFSNGMALIRQGNGYTYINKKGRILEGLLPKMAYPFSEGLAAIETGGKWGYINHKGRLKLAPWFDWAGPFSEGRATVSLGYKKGYINKKGQLAILPQFEEAHPFRNGVAIVRKNRRYGLIDRNGRVLQPPIFYKIELWEEDFYRLSLLHPKTHRVEIHGLADARGRLLLDTVYKEITLIQSKYIKVKKDSLTGYFSRKGKQLIPLTYTRLGFISEEGYLAACRDGKWGFIDIRGRQKLAFEYDDCRMGFSEGRSWVLKDSCFLLLDNKMRVRRRCPQYSTVFYFNNGYAIVGKKDSAGRPDDQVYGFVDRQGREQIPARFHTAWPFNPDGLSVVGIRQEGITAQYLINTRNQLLNNDRSYFSLETFGRLIYSPGHSDKGLQYADSSGFHPHPQYTQLIPLRSGERKDLACVLQGHLEGLLDTSLQLRLPIAYDVIHSMHQGRMALRKEGKWGYADERFQIRIPFGLDKADDFAYGLAVVHQGKKTGVINPKGQWVIPPTYSDLHVDFGSDRIFAERQDSTFIFDNQGRLLLATPFEYIGYFGNQHYAYFRKNKKLGYLDYNLKVICAPQYDGAGHFYDGRAWVVNNKKGGYMDERFQVVIPLQFDAIEDFALGFTKVKKGDRQYYIDIDGQEVFPTQEAIKAREAELERREKGWIDFSS